MMKNKETVFYHLVKDVGSTSYFIVKLQIFYV